MITRIGNLIVKELIQFRRDRMLSIFILLAPALQLILMAQNVERGITEQPVAILDQDHGRFSRQLVVSLDNTEELHVVYHVQNMEQVRNLMDQGDARLAVVIPTGFSQELNRSHLPHLGARPIAPIQVGIIADATNTLAAATTLVLLPQLARIAYQGTHCTPPRWAKQPEIADQFLPDERNIRLIRQSAVVVLGSESKIHNHDPALPSRAG